MSSLLHEMRRRLLEKSDGGREAKPRLQHIVGVLDMATTIADDAGLGSLLTEDSSAVAIDALCLEGSPRGEHIATNILF